MTLHIATKLIAICAILAGATPAFPHIFLESGSAAAGTAYKAAFQVGHGCKGSPTTGLSVQIPDGFQGAKPYPKAGWNLSTQLGKLAKPYEQHGQQVLEDTTLVSWTAGSPAAALPDAYFDEFVLRGKLPATPGPLWFKVLQTCENGSNSWSEVPASGVSVQGLKSPAVLLEVVARTAAALQPAISPSNVPVASLSSVPAITVSAAWVRATVPGQKSSGAFMRLTARTAMRLTGVSTPLAGAAEIHDMKMDGDIMKMRPLTAGLALPAGTTVDLKASGLHLMLMDLKKTLVAGGTVPMTLLLRDAKGVSSKVELRLPVALSEPASAASVNPVAAGMDHSAH